MRKINIIKNLLFVSINENYTKPKRSTEDSAGHDVFSAKDFVIKPSERVTVEIPFIIKNVPTDYSANLYLRSSFGIKKGMRLVEDGNIVSHVKLDHSSKGEITLLNDSDKEIKVKKNEHFCQIIFTKNDDKNVPFKLEEVSVLEAQKHKLIPDYSLKCNNNKEVLYIIENELKLKAKEQLIFPIGLKAKIDKGTYLEANLHQVLSSKAILSNGIGIIDADYYNNESNEGIMFIALNNLENEEIIIPKGTPVISFTCKKYYISGDERNNPILSKRTGGIGHTTKE